MANYGIAAGRKTNLAVREIEKGDSTVKITKVWDYIEDITHEINTSPPAIIDDLKSIVLLDAAFKDKMDTDVMAREFLVLQDALQSKGLSKVKLNLVTSKADLYKVLGGSVDGVDGIYYSNVEVYLYDNRLSFKFLIEILKGAYDYTSLYNKKAHKKDILASLEEQRRALVEDSKVISDDVLRHGQDKPISEMNQEDYIDSAKSKQKLAEREKEIRRKKAEIESLKKKAERESQKKSKATKPKNTAIEDDLSDTMIDLEDLDLDMEELSNIDIEIPSLNSKNKAPTSNPVALDSERYTKVTEAPLGAVKGTVNVSAGTDSTIPTVAELSELFRRLEQADDGTIEQKLKSDKAVISVISPHNMGGSGFVAQGAEMYAMLGKRVLIVDLDIEKRMQTLYFNTYTDAAKEYKGNENSLIQASQGVDISDTAVPVTSRIDMLSISRMIETIDKDFSATLSSMMQYIIQKAVDSYDIVFLDLPIKFLNYYLRNLDVVDRNVFVLDNKFYTIEDFFSITLNDILGDDDLIGMEFIKKSSVVLNKFEKGNRDLDGYQINKYKVKEMLIAAGNPYDNIMVAGEVPMYKDWESQFLNGVRFIWKDNLALGIYREIFSKIV